MQQDNRTLKNVSQACLIGLGKKNPEYAHPEWPWVHTDQREEGKYAPPERPWICIGQSLKETYWCLISHEVRIPPTSINIWNLKTTITIKSIKVKAVEVMSIACDTEAQRSPRA